MQNALHAHDRAYTSADYTWIQQHCPICGEEPRQFLGFRGGDSHRMRLGVRCEVWRCTVCDFIFPNPMPIPRHGLGQHYDIAPEDYFYRHGHDDARLHAELLIHQAEQILSVKGRLLDVGSGRGEVARAAKAMGWEIVAVEPSATFAESLRQSDIKVVQKAVEDCEAELGERSFDAAILSAVLEHLYDPDAVTKALSRLLRPGGILFIDVPNEHGLYSRIGNLYERVRGKKATVNLCPTFAPYHVFGFSPKSLRKLLRKHDLEPVRWRVYRGKTPLPRRAGVVGALESSAVWAVNLASEFGEMGLFIETWAKKSGAR